MSSLQIALYFLPRLVVPPLTTFALLHAFPHSQSLPTWLISTLCILSVPTALLIAVLWQDFQDRRAADRLGAILPSRVQDSSFLGLNTMRVAVQNFKNGYLGEHMLNWAHQYGWSYNMRALFENKYVTMEPEHIKAVLATNFVSFEKGPKTNLQLHQLLGTGVFNSDGEMWKFHRGMTRPFFSRERITDFELFDKHAQETLRLLRERLREGYVVDFQDLVSRFTLDSATSFLFGTDVCSLAAGLPYPTISSPTSTGTTMPSEHPANTFARAFLDTQIRTAIRSRYGAGWPLAELFDSSIKRNMKVIYGFVEPIVARAAARVKEPSSNGEKTEREGEEPTLLDHLVNYTRDGWMRSTDPNVLRDETLNILLAGRDTTASLLSSTIYALSTYPDVLVRLRTEILDQIGSERAPTFDDFRRCRYLRAVLNEVLRLWPPVPFNSRCAAGSTLLPSTVPGGKPIYVPAGTRVMYSVFLMHRRTDLWGPDAMEFDPDRFLDARVQKYLTTNPFIFLPFNAGPRICLGQQFAYNEASFFLVRLLQMFDGVSLAPEAQPRESIPPYQHQTDPLHQAKGEKVIGGPGRETVWFRTHLTMFYEGGLWVRMKEAESKVEV
ncbi:hypothetical protein EW146_g2752 [Bondarzewia mesenterica]|uniref:Cytochrome P450 n=1 Tax=Bondarzewia mesenterica TaxID=1095465 RepID=A0A4S4M207_9AGAM|nr:hypothetical protein EW146_g2752 [Bondarzewia mesenterica]